MDAEGIDGKPTHLAAVLDEADFDRIEAVQSPVMLNEDLVRFAPARAYGDWLEGLGLPDIAERVRAQLTEKTAAGVQFDAMVAALQGRRSLR